MRLLLLYSDMGWGATLPGAVRDLGALLPALAVACCQEPRYGSHRPVSTAALPELEHEVTNLVKAGPLPPFNFADVRFPSLWAQPWQHRCI